MPARTDPPPTRNRHGQNIVRAAFVLAMFGWGFGFYGPPIFLHAVVLRTGWPLSLVSAAVTCHFLLGAGVVACLPRLHRRFGIARTTAGGTLTLAIGTLGWALAQHPWQLFVAALLTGGGWAPLGAAAINAIVSPWFVQGRPVALARAYNGASAGGLVFSPLWTALIAGLGFGWASLGLGLLMLLVVLMLTRRVLSQTPIRDDAADAKVAASGSLRPPAASLWRDRGFITLAAAMALGLFAQIGLIAQLYVLLAPGIGAQAAGWLMAMATGCSIAGRSIGARLMGRSSASIATTPPDRRLLACASYGMQALGTVLLLLAQPQQLTWIVAGIALFGLGIGNATSLPPLVAQAEFAEADVPRVVARCVALAQALYAFAPAALALLLLRNGGATPAIGVGTPLFFAAVLLCQALAMACMLAGRRGPSHR